MGTKVQIENFLPGHCSMRDLSRESNGASWPSCYSDNNLPNGQYYYGFLPRTIADCHPGYNKDVVKQTMLEHEAIFKNQVCELHRLYQVQRNLMDEVRREQYKRRIPYETSSSSSPVPSQMQSEDLRRWKGSSLPSSNPVFGISGPETVQSSPLSAKGKTVQTGPSPFQSCSSPKNSEASESRPTKFRRRMLDLQLPAEEYVDTDEVEQFDGAKVSDNISPSPDKNARLAPNKIGDSDLHVGKSMALADLNEPLNVEETTAVSSVEFLRHAGSRTDAAYPDLSTNFLNSKDGSQNFRHGSLNGTLNSLPLETRPNGQHWIYGVESEQNKGSLRTINQGVNPEKPFQPVQVLHEQPCQPPFLTGDRFKMDQWRAKIGGNVEKSDRSYSVSNYNLPEPIIGSHVQSQPSLFPSDLGKSWDQGASSWGKSGSCMTQKSAPIQGSPFLSSANLSKSPQSSAQSNDLFGNRWNLNNAPGVNNVAFGYEAPMRNGLCPPALKDRPSHFPPVGFDYVNCSSNASPVKDMNLNVALPNGVSYSHVNHQGVKVVDKEPKSEDPLPALPWLRGKSAYTDEAENSRKASNSLELALLRGCDGNENAQKPDISDCPSTKKILGVPIFVNPPTLKKENSDLCSGKEEIGKSRRKVVFDMNLPCELSDSEQDNMGEEAEVTEVIDKKIVTEAVSIRNHFDLNSCITEEETTCITSIPDNSTGVKADTGIDLEAPIILETDDVIPLEDASLANELEKQPELPSCRADDGEVELAKSAAEAIIAISSVILNHSEEGTTAITCEASMDDPLHWFVHIACSSGDDLDHQLIADERDRGQNGDCLPEGLDDYEYMILRLKECSFEEYFPKPSFPEVPNAEENGSRVLTTRTRKGQARRGRQRRDFQRDILPGLTTLSRHEVTEDLQTFGGLMRATGHPWHSGPNRRNATRNGCGRGRRRGASSAVVAPAPAHTVSVPPKQQHQVLVHGNSMEMSVEDRSLTGWGKTTRRPRRQRCPAGNPPPPLPLS